MLDIAPSPQVTRLLERLEPAVHIRTDLGADPRNVDCYANLTELPFSDNAFDFLICYHVLEHVPDDASAMQELARVLASGGVGLVQVPWRSDADTDEDPGAPVEERVRRFGQADHVRFYGRDFEDRLVAAGLRVRRIVPGHLVGAGACELLRLNPEEMVWLVSPADAPAVSLGRPDAVNGLARMLDDVVERLGRERVQRDRARGRVERLRTRLERRDAGSTSLARRVVRRSRRIAGRVRRAVRPG